MARLLLLRDRNLQGETIMQAKGMSAIAAAFLASAAAAAPINIPVAAFRSIELNGGGQVILRHGPQQRVTLLSGSPDVSWIAVDPGEQAGRSRMNRRQDKLVIETCRRSCGKGYKLVVEVVTPAIEGVAVRGGGRIAANGAFPAQANLGAAIDGGGIIDIRALPGRQVGAAVHGGGRIMTTAQNSLGAAINGGGEVVYWGNPKVGSAVNGGGSVRRGN